MLKRIKDYQRGLYFSICDKLIREKYNHNNNIVICLDYKNNYIFCQVEYILNFFKLWNIQVTFFKYDLPVPHNGCRRSHKARKRNKGRKKNIIT